MLNLGARQRGVTLIELTIGVVLMGLLAAIAIPSFKDWIQNSQVRTATQSLSEGLQLARAEAVRVNGPVGFAITNINGAAWSVSTLNVNDLSAVAVVQSRSATETSNALVTASATTVCFNGSGQQVVAAEGVCPARTTVTLDISNPAGGACVAGGPVRCLRVVVRTGGQIRMCDPVLPNTDTQSC